MDNSVPVVVVVDKGGYGALPIARSLGRLGVHTYLITPKGQPAISASRYWTKRFLWDFSAPHDQLLEFLLNVGGEVGSRPILLTLTDWLAIFIQDNASALEQRFIFPKPSPSVLRLLTNKWQMSSAAKQHGVPAPEATYPHSRDDVLKFLETARFPIIIKGVDQMLPHAKTKEIVSNAHDLLEIYDSAADSGPANLMLQEFIPGDDQTVWMCNAYFDARSECRAVFTGKKLRQSPPHVGVASLAICLPNEAVEQSTRRFMQAVGYQGCVGIGYRYDARDGLYKVLDVNARVSAVFRLFVATNGMDVVRVCYLDLTRQPIPELVASPGRKWLLEDDLLASRKYAMEGTLTFGQWLTSLRGIREMHYTAADDLAPIFVWSWLRLGLVWEKLAALTKSLSRAVAAFWKRRTAALRPATQDGPPTNSTVKP